MSNAYCGFIDAGYLRAQGSRACGITGGQAKLQGIRVCQLAPDQLAFQAACVAPPSVAASAGRWWSWEGAVDEQWDVFVSYAHEDQEWVRVLAENLHRAGRGVDG